MIAADHADHAEVRNAARLFWFFFALYALTSSGNPFRVPDEFEVYFQAERLADAGDLSVPQTLTIRQGGQPIFFGKFGRDGRPYAPYGPGVAFLILPFHLAGRAVAALAGVPRVAPPEGVAWEVLVGGLTALGMACAAALAVAGCYRALRAAGATVRRALALSAIAGGATFLWAYGTSLYSEAWLAAAFVWAAALLLQGGARRVALAAALVAIAGLTKPTALVIAPGFVVATLLTPRSTVRGRAGAALAVSAAIAAATAAHVAWNLWRFGQPLDFGYNLGAMIPYPPARPFMLEEVPRGLFVQLLTPGKSIFVWAPITLLTLLSLRDAWRVDRGIVAGLLTAAVAALLFYGAFLFPDGGYSHGPRHLLPLVPLALLPLASPRIALPRRGVIACAAFGAVMAIGAVSVSFLEDQAPVQTSRQLLSPYYERIDPAPGAPDLRYRADYIPFKHALTSGRWLSPERAVGEGPDLFVVHLARARASLPGGTAIPAALPWLLALPWIAAGVWAGYALAREWKSTMNRSNA